MQKEATRKNSFDSKKPDNIEFLKKKSIDALEEEIKKIEEEGFGSSQYRLVNGQKITHEDELIIYRFVTDDIIELPDDLPIEVKISNIIASGYIVTIVGFEVTVAVEKDLGEYVPSAILLSSAKFLLEKIKSCLEDIDDVNPNFNYKIVEKTFNLKNQTCSPLSENIQCHPACSNPKQRQAILTSLRNEILFVWGPPGTGKTTTLGGIVHSYLNNCDDLKLLVLSHTNVATDRAAEKIIDLCNEHQLLTEGKIIRLGNIVEDPKNKVLDDHKIELIKISKIAEKKTVELMERRSKLEQELDKLTKENEKIRELFMQKEQLAKYKKNIDQLNEDLKNKNFNKDEARSGLQTYKFYLRNIEEKIQKAENASKFTRFISGWNLEKLELGKKSHEREIEKCQKRLEALQHEILKIKDEILEQKRFYARVHNNLFFVHSGKYDVNQDNFLVEIEHEGKIQVKCNNCDNLLRVPNETGRYKCPNCGYEFNFFSVQDSRDIDWEKIESDTESNTSRIKEIRVEITSLTTKINEINDQIIKDARVIITTVTQSFSSKLISSMNFDVVIVDEASMIPLPILFFVSGLSTKNMVVIGDFKQLPPISISENEYLNTDIFVYSGIRNNVENDIDDDRLVALNEQYRMHPDISEICNNFVYRPQNELQDSEKVKNPKSHEFLKNEPYFGEPIVFCDTACASPWCNSNPSGSVFNLYHSILILKLVEDAIKDGVPDNKIAVITPYRDQAKFINRMRQKMLPDNGIRISTVHKSQGLENDITIFDTTVSFGKKAGPGFFFRNSDQANRLLNVAISRPKSKLIIVGNASYLNDRLDTDTLMFKILDHFKSKNKVFESDNIIEKYYDQLRLTKEQFKRDIDQEVKAQYFSVVDQNDFFDIFKEDLLSIDKNEGVVIFSPFIQYGRTSYLMDVFKAVIDRGAKLTIFTEKKYQQPGLFSDSIKEILDYLTRIGADIKYRYKAHEKRAFISNRIWWEGSLNILSHSGTTEDMLRISQKSIIELVINNFGLSSLLGVGKIKRDERDKWQTIIKDALRYEEKRCEKCKGRLVVKFSRYGPFLACEHKICKNIASIPLKNYRKRINDAKIQCTECKKGYIQVKTSRKGGKFSTFLGCDNYPNCKFIPRI